MVMLVVSRSELVRFVAPAGEFVEFNHSQSPRNAILSLHDQPSDFKILRVCFCVRRCDKDYDLIGLALAISIVEMCRTAPTTCSGWFSEEQRFWRCDVRFITDEILDYVVFSALVLGRPTYAWRPEADLAW